MPEAEEPRAVALPGPAGAEQETGQHVAGPVLGDVEPPDADDRHDHGHQYPGRDVERAGEVAAAEDQDQVAEEPDEEEGVAARKAVSVGVTEDVDQVRRGAGPVDEHLEQRVGAAAERAPGHQQEALAVEQEDDHQADRGERHLLQPLEEVDRPESGDERTPVGALDRPLDPDVDAAEGLGEHHQALPGEGAESRQRGQEEPEADRWT